MEYEWADQKLAGFVEVAEKAKAVRGAKSAQMEAKKQVPVVREILRRLDEDLAEFKVGGWAGWDPAIDAAIAGRGSIEVVLLAADKLGGLEPRPSSLRGLHPLVYGAARALIDANPTAAVATAAEQLTQNVRTRTGRNDIEGTNVWDQAFSSGEPGPGKPRLRWPGDPDDTDVKGMRDGLRSLAKGLQLTVRNRAAHQTEALTRDEAMERLAALSLLAGLVERCDLVSATDADGPTH